MLDFDEAAFGPLFYFWESAAQLRVRTALQCDGWCGAGADAARYGRDAEHEPGLVLSPCAGHTRNRAGKTDLRATRTGPGVSVSCSLS